MLSMTFSFVTFFFFCKGGGRFGLLQRTYSNTYWNGPLCRWLFSFSYIFIITYSVQNTINTIFCGALAWYFISHWFSFTRFLILHLWHPEEPRLETFPRAAGAPLLRQPSCPRPENPRQPALWRGCWCHRSDNIVSAVGRQPTIFTWRPTYNDELTM